MINEAELRRKTHDERRELARALELSGGSGPAPPLWRVPLFADGLEECLPARLRSGAGDERAADVTAGGRPSS